VLAGCFAVKSSTYNAFPFFRIALKQGGNGFDFKN
jgi:hypothetical protein